MREVIESDFSSPDRLGFFPTSGERSEVMGLREVIESDFSCHVSRDPYSSNLLVGVSSHACARAARAVVAAASLSCSRCSSLALSGAVVARAVGTPMHAARNSLACGGTGLTERRGTKGRASGLAEDWLPVSEVEAGVNFRPAVYGGRL